MSSPSPFMVAREASNNLGNAFTRVKDENNIERILAGAMSSGSPEVLQNSIGQILSQVSPERQGAAIQYLQSAFNNAEKKKLMAKEDAEKKRRREAAEKLGLSADLPDALQLEQFKQNAKQSRLNQVFGQPQPPASVGGPVTPAGSRDQGTQPNAPARQPLAEANQNQADNPFFRFSDGQLVALSGSEDREIAEGAKQELKRRQEKAKIDQRMQSDVFRADLDRAQKILLKADEIAETLPQKTTALNLMDNAISSRNLEWWSPDNLAEVTGIEAFRSPEGALFKTAAKEYFLGSISRAGTRPNQWIEQQISDMLTKIGRSTAANLSVSRALRNELDLDRERVRVTEEISNRLREQGDLSMSKLGPEVNKHMQNYAETKQRELFNDLRAIKAIDDKQPQKFKKVESGTEISKVMAQALLRQFNNDATKAREEAQKLGYKF